jgi:hypothetical protein
MSSTIKSISAQDPDLSINSVFKGLREYVLINSFSALSKPSSMDNFTFSGKLGFFIIKLCKLSLRKSAQRDPP